MSKPGLFGGARRKVRAFAKKDKSAYKKIYFLSKKQARHSFDDIGDDGIRSVIESNRSLATDKDPVIRASARGRIDSLRAVLAERAKKAGR
jgi:hypothetical protein